ncbi:MAG: dihydrolipoyl dehydrogenase [Methanomassiliicoccales archaeon]|nr:dihydrolipoyl dehydrogenase [Methanomassiliicoccales archaeon]
MKDYDLIVIGSGAGMNVAAKARSQGLSVAVVEDGPLGGTCLNRGCIPSKIIIEPATLIREIEHGRAIGVTAKVESIDFELIRRRMWELVLHDRHQMEEGVRSDEGVALYNIRSKFIGPKTMQAGEEKIRGQKIMIAAGVRTAVPNISGLEEAGYLSSETVFDFEKLPTRLAILGGGYKACEFGHFFSGMGVQVAIIGRNKVLLPREEPEVSDLVADKMREYLRVETNKEVVQVRRDGGGKTLVCRDRESGEMIEIAADEILVTTGVRSNADLLDVAATGVKTDEHNYIVVNEYLETSAPGIWAFGDIIGRNMFRHTANYGSDIAWFNAYGKVKVKFDEHAVPHAVFTYPEVGAVGMTEADAKARGRRYFIGFALYSSCAKGFAMADEDSFVKVIIDPETLRILGATVCGPQASILVQPLVYLMNCGDQTFTPIARSQVIHPALSEAVVNALANLMDPEHHHEHTG